MIPKRIIDISLLPFAHNRHLTGDLKYNYIHLFKQNGIHVSLDQTVRSKITHTMKDSNILYLNIMDSSGKEWCKTSGVCVQFQTNLIYSLSLPN